MAFVLYDQERKTLEAFVQYVNRFGYAPTLRELAVLVGVSSAATVHEHILTLVEKGFLVKTEHYRRGYDLSPQLKRRELENVEVTIDLPHFGFIAAGSPIEPHEDPTASFKVPASMVDKDKPGYALQVKGNSMVEDGILDGDYVIVEYVEEANNGELVIAFLEESGFATLKRFFREGERVVLKPANAQMQPIYATKVKIQGRVVGLIRKF